MDIASIKDARVRSFYSLYWPQHEILRGFYERLAEEQYDLRLVDTPERRADTPRQSLVHILYVQLVYWDSAKLGKLEFGPQPIERYPGLSKAELLAEWERIDAGILAHLTAPNFDSDKRVAVFWGGDMNCIDVLYFLRDHDILHIGWNLALMDHVNMPRYDSLIQYWG